MPISNKNFKNRIAEKIFIFDQLSTYRPKTCLVGLINFFSVNLKFTAIPTLIFSLTVSLVLYFDPFLDEMAYAHSVNYHYHFIRLVIIYSCNTQLFVVHDTF